jgi:hypothetical protein
MPIEIKEMIVRAIWGSDIDNKSGNTSPEEQKAKAEDSEAATETKDMQSNIRKLLEQTQER